jgi:hypothetical protein
LYGPDALAAEIQLSALPALFVLCAGAGPLAAAQLPVLCVTAAAVFLLTLLILLA